jgi:hypothetical protein
MIEASEAALKGFEKTREKRPSNYDSVGRD